MGLPQKSPLCLRFSVVKTVGPAACHCDEGQGAVAAAHAVEPRTRAPETPQRHGVTELLLGLPQKSPLCLRFSVVKTVGPAACHCDEGQGAVAAAHAVEPRTRAPETPQRHGVTELLLGLPQKSPLCLRFSVVKTVGPAACHCDEGQGAVAAAHAVEPRTRAPETPQRHGVTELLLGLPQKSPLCLRFSVVKTVGPAACHCDEGQGAVAAAHAVEPRTRAPETPQRHGVTELLLGLPQKSPLCLRFSVVKTVVGWQRDGGGRKPRAIRRA